MAKSALAAKSALKVAGLHALEFLVKTLTMDHRSATFASASPRRGGSFRVQGRKIVATQMDE